MKCGNETEPATHKTELTFGLNSTKCTASKRVNAI